MLLNCLSRNDFYLCRDQFNRLVQDSTFTWDPEERDLHQLRLGPKVNLDFLALPKLVDVHLITTDRRGTPCLSLEFRHKIGQ